MDQARDADAGNAWRRPDGAAGGAAPAGPDGWAGTERRWGTDADAWEIVSPGLTPPAVVPPTAGPSSVGSAESPPSRSGRSVLPIVAVALVALALGVLGGAVLGVAVADDQARVDALTGEVAELEGQVTGLEREVSDTLHQAEAEVARARADAEAAVAAENAARQAELDAREAAVADREDELSLLEQQAADSSIPGDGVHLVGSEVAPGTYRADVTERCYWERRSGLSGEFREIIANGYGAADATVTIRASDVAFASERCGSWQRIS